MLARAPRTNRANFGVPPNIVLGGVPASRAWRSKGILCRLMVVAALFVALGVP